MTNFNGKNKTKSSIQLTFERAKYKKYMNNNRNLVIKDLNFAEFAQYGRIDPSMNIVYNTGQSLKQIPSDEPGNTIMAVDFVVDAFTSIKNRIKRAVFQGAIPKDDPYLSSIRAFKGFQSPIAAYEEYIHRMLQNYNDIFLQDYTVNNFDDYYKFFLDFSTRMGYNYPMTFSGFQRSKQSNIFTTGLAVSVADFPIDDDSNKEKYFIDSPVFPLFKNICLNNGMILAENSPWVMVADILSPSLSLYTKNYNLSSKNSIFLKYFDYCTNKDLDLLINNLLIYYRKYYNKNIYYNNIKLCKQNKINIDKIFLEPLNLQEIKLKYTDNFLYDMYIRIKNIEEYNYFSSSDVNKIIERAKNFEKNIDKSAAIGYIKDEFRNVHKFRHGNLNYKAQRAKGQTTEGQQSVRSQTAPQSTSAQTSQATQTTSSPQGSQGGSGGISNY